MCLCFYFSSSLKLWPIVPYSPSSIPGSWGWISQQCAGLAASLIRHWFGFFWVSMPRTTCWYLPAVTLVEEPLSSSRVTHRQGWWCFAGSEELSWAVISSLSFPLQVQRSSFCLVGSALWGLIQYETVAHAAQEKSPMWVGFAVCPECHKARQVLSLSRRSCFDVWRCWSSLHVHSCRNFKTKQWAENLSLCADLRRECLLFWGCLFLHLLRESQKS